MTKVSRKQPTRKPPKPHEGFPLYAHASGRWAKKIRQKTLFFGPWRSPDEALAKYLDQRDDLQAGRTPRTAGDGLNIRDLVNRFLTSKRLRLDAGELTPRSFQDYFATCDRIIKAFGKTRLVSDLGGEDFEAFRAKLAKRWSPVTLSNEVNRVRIVFRYAHENQLIEHPVRFGTGFRRPAKRILLQARQAAEPKLFEAADVRAMLKAAKPQMRAMILLAVGMGYGNTDVATLPLGALDLDHGWVDFPRPKTAVLRRAPLWPETTEALRVVLEARKTPKDSDAANMVFITRHGKQWGNGTNSNPVSGEFRKLLKSLGLHRPRVGFYSLRHTFRTVADESRDQPAIDHVMGHESPGMASVYREKISDDRLRAVSDYVRNWLFTED